MFKSLYPFHAEYFIHYIPPQFRSCYPAAFRLQACIFRVENNIDPDQSQLIWI